jgi:hypothetical protein
MKESLIALIRDSGAFDSVLDPDEAGYLAERLADRIATLTFNQPAATGDGDAGEREEVARWFERESEAYRQKANASYLVGSRQPSFPDGWAAAAMANRYRLAAAALRAAARPERAAALVDKTIASLKARLGDESEVSDEEAAELWKLVDFSALGDDEEAQPETERVRALEAAVSWHLDDPGQHAVGCPQDRSRGGRCLCGFALLPDAAVRSVAP